MSKRIADNFFKDSKQPRLTGFITTTKSNETSTSSSSGAKKYCPTFVNVLLNVNLKTRIGKLDAKSIRFVSAVPEFQASSSITPEAHSTTLAAVSAEQGTIDSNTVNVAVTLNITADTELAGK